jgi:hypothetical protein
MVLRESGPSDRSGCRCVRWRADHPDPSTKNRLAYGSHDSPGRITQVDLQTQRSIDPEPGEETTAGRAKIDDLLSGLHRTPFPSELWGLAVFIVLLLGCGVLWPLVLLERPSSLTRWGLTLSIVLLAGAALLYFCCSAKKILNEHKQYALVEYKAAFGGAELSGLLNKSESADSG